MLQHILSLKARKKSGCIVTVQTKHVEPLTSRLLASQKEKAPRHNKGVIWADLSP